jgi:hypothetical protein
MERVREILNEMEILLVSIAPTGSVRAQNPETAKKIDRFFFLLSELEDLGTTTLFHLKKEAENPGPMYHSRANLACKVLSLLKFTEATEILIELALHPDFIVADRAGRQLLNIKGTEERIELLRKSANSDGTHAGFQIKAALINLLATHNLDMLTKCIETEKNAYYRLALLEIAVSRVSDSSAALFKAFREDQDPGVRCVALSGLILCGNKALTSELVEYISSRKNELRVHGYRWMNRILLPKYIPHFLDGAKDKSAEIRLISLASLHDIGLPQCGEKLLAGLNDKNPGIRQQAAFFLESYTGAKLGYQWSGSSILNFGEISRKYTEILSSRMKELRYRGDQPLGIPVLIDQLGQFPHGFWQLLSATGQHFKFNPQGDIVDNWHSIREWADWARDQGDTYEPGHFYFLGGRMQD